MAFSTGKVVFLLFWCFYFSASVKGIKRGKIDMQQVGVNDFHCQYVSFSASLSGIPLLFVSLNHGDDSPSVHDSAFIWVEDVTTSGFSACLVQGGQVSGDNRVIDWFAFEGPRTGVLHGESAFSRFTTGTKCNLVVFPQTFAAVPNAQVTVNHRTLNQKQDAMSVWIENLSRSQFEVCLRESRTFDGPHEGISVSWMAYESLPPEFGAQESLQVEFSENEVPTAEENYAICKQINFTIPYYEPPVVLAAVRNEPSNIDNAGCLVKEPLNGWLEEITKSQFRVCIKDDAGYNGQRSTVIVDYLVVGDLDPCSNVSCKYHSKCEASSPQRFTCVCENSCPSYEEQVCASNGQTFRNLCLLRQQICRTRGNYTAFHPGSCTGFPVQKGRHKFLNVPLWAEDQCEPITFEPYIFYPHKKIYIQLTVNHVNYSDPSFVHEATTPWVENVNSTHFTACVTRAGRNDYPADSFATVDWVAYQGAPSGGIAGEEKFARWWTGTSCKTVTFPSGKFINPPMIFATALHYRSGLKHDAASVWLEEVSSNSFQICLRELQNFAGVHDDISVSWIAFESIHRPLFSEHNDVSFQNLILPPESNNFAFCQDVTFLRSYTELPTVVLTVKHSTNFGNVAAESNGMTSWIEFITGSGFRICVKELFVQQFDPLTVSYAVMPDVCQDGWIYFEGFCYSKVSDCDTWGNSQRICSTMGANLPSIHSQEENVFFQNLQGGEHAWLGLSDINSEGTFVWSDGTPYDFHYWAEDQPNDYGNEDCVHALGFLPNHSYEWNDVNCSACKKFTCKKDHNECQTFSNNCPVESTCVNDVGSYSCQCSVGYFWDGNNCADVDECSLGAYSCHAQAQCDNVQGSYQCSCSPGYRGDGINSCSIIQIHGTSSCHSSRVWQLPDGTEVIESNQIGTLYSDNSDCYWVLSSNARIELTFLRFELESGDYVSVHDGGTEFSPLIGQFSGSYLPSPVTSSSNSLFVRFTSDYSVTSLGFRARYRVLTEGAVRIVGNDPTTGRVEVFQNDQWGTICDNGWDTNDGLVVCRQLGFDQVSQVFSGASHGQGNGPIWIDQLACSGNEASIYGCGQGVNRASCTHGQDASVACSYNSPVIRLVNGWFNNGRVEVFDSGIWGTICDDTWDINDANVACRQLGFTGALSANVTASFGQGSGPIWRDHINCDGSESSLLDCPFSQHGIGHCIHSEDSGVVCYH